MNMDNKGMDRRGFLRVLQGAGAGLAAFGGLGPITRLAHAEALGGQDRYYVFCYFPGGWDILLGLDPRDPGVFNAGQVNSTGIQAGYEFLTGMPNAANVDLAPGMTVGPYLGTEMAALKDRLCIVRGMSMDTLTHEVGRRRFITGKPPSGLQARGSSASAYLAEHLGAEEPIPNLNVQVEGYNVDLPTYASPLKVNSVPDLLRALRPGTPTLDSRTQLHVDALLQTEASCGYSQNSALLKKAESARRKSRQMVQGGLDTLFDFAANTPQMQELRSYYGIATNNLGTPEAQAALAARALTSGISRCVSIAVTGSLDTHFENWGRDQGPAQMRGFNVVARLAQDLARTQFKDTSESWLDRTTIVGFSEFSRTPRLNDRTGRDHALTNACFMLGGRVKGATVVGASSNFGMAPQHVDLATGRVDEASEHIIHPEHVLRTLMVDAGITDDVADLRVPPITAAMRTL